MICSVISQSKNSREVSKIPKLVELGLGRSALVMRDPQLLKGKFSGLLYCALDLVGS